MHLWIAGSVEEVLMASRTGLVDAIVTNPTVIAKWTGDGRSLEEVAGYVCGRSDLPLYIQLRGPDTATFLGEAEHLKSVSPRIVPKLPATLDGLQAVSRLEKRGIPTLVTTVCSLNQAYAAAAANASAICPYIGRLNESGTDAFELIRLIAEMYRRQAVPTVIVPASVRSAEDMTQTLRSGAHGVIVFYDLFLSVFENDVMRKSLEGFEIDWKGIPYRGRGGADF